MIIIFYFIFKIFKNLILDIELSRIFKNVSTCTRCSILQNGLYVNEILIFYLFQVSGALKNAYVLSNYACYNHNILKF
jgi:hypothetical protein